MKKKDWASEMLKEAGWLKGADGIWRVPLSPITAKNLEKSLKKYNDLMNKGYDRDEAWSTALEATLPKKKRKKNAR